MQEITIKLYGIGEFTGKVKETALDEYRYINVEHNWWDFIYYDFAEICKTIGITVDITSIRFSGFYSQGDGSAFDATVNMPTCVEGITNEAWKEYAPNEKLYLSTVDIDKRILNLYAKQLIDQPQIVGNDRAYYVRAEQNYDFMHYKRTDFSNIEKHLEIVIEWVKTIAKQLNRLLYSMLEREYEYLIGVGAVQEAIEANEYVFTKDGAKANKLLRFAEEEKQD
ncbi:MAG TPA: hypothetical protein VG738_18640 [Chitinophagaceae bacterium]|nr:hypothetical protein [Chitinophagaceae bacterium]